MDLFAPGRWVYHQRSNEKKMETLMHLCHIFKKENNNFKIIIFRCQFFHVYSFLMSKEYQEWSIISINSFFKFNQFFHFHLNSIQTIWKMENWFSWGFPSPKGKIGCNGVILFHKSHKMTSLYKLQVWKEWHGLCGR
jgi:hypothetical protein